MEFRQVHLDFHTSEAIAGVGDDFDSENFAETLQKAEVGIVNVFAKCHHGMLYYDTLSEARHPNLKFDILGEQLKACKKYGIKTQVYFSAAMMNLSPKEKKNGGRGMKMAHRHRASRLRQFGRNFVSAQNKLAALPIKHIYLYPLNRRYKKLLSQSGEIRIVFDLLISRFILCAHPVKLALPLNRH